jgi:hypothetical protein
MLAVKNKIRQTIRGLSVRTRMINPPHTAEALDDFILSADMDLI